MVVNESEISEVVESPLQVVDQAQQKSHPFSDLGRKSSIYSVTLDEFQHTLFEGGKNFGSMNMDEVLASIWNAEENQAIINSNNNNNHQKNYANKQVSSAQVHLPLNETASSKGLAKQPSLPRQGSLTLPAPLCRKTVDEVWSEIQRRQQGQGQSNDSNAQNAKDDASTRWPTFGEMTLEDFLIKAGLVREQCIPPPPAPPPRHHLPQHRLHQTNNNPTVDSGSVSRSSRTAYQTMPSGLNDGNTGCGHWQAAPSLTAVAGGYGPGKVIGVMALAPMSPPVSSEGMCSNQVDNAATDKFGIEMGGVRGRKRMIDVPIEKVVDRRQRRMIKNRESAARSRARKQAYTLELEAELNQLKQENEHLKQALAGLERKRKQQCFEEWETKTKTKAQKAKEKLRIMRRNQSCPL